MIFTRAMLDQGKSSNNGWNKQQMEVLGVIQNKGWVSRLVGLDIPEEKIKKFISLKDCHFSRHPDKLKNRIMKNKIKNFPSFEYCDSKIPYKEQYTHPNWQKMRLFILNRDKFTCINCKAKDKTLHVHHLKYDRKGFIWSVPNWYLVTLCEMCHSEEHGRDLTIKH